MGEGEQGQQSSGPGGGPGGPGPPGGHHPMHHQPMQQQMLVRGQMGAFPRGPPRGVPPGLTPRPGINTGGPMSMGPPIGMGQRMNGPRMRGPMPMGPGLMGPPGGPGRPGGPSGPGGMQSGPFGGHQQGGFQRPSGPPMFPGGPGSGFPRPDPNLPGGFALVSCDTPNYGLSLPRGNRSAKAHFLLSEPHALRQP